MRRAPWPAAGVCADQAGIDGLVDGEGGAFQDVAGLAGGQGEGFHGYGVLVKQPKCRDVLIVRQACSGRLCGPDRTAWFSSIPSCLPGTVAMRCPCLPRAGENG
jgi:hypothetical protein